MNDNDEQAANAADPRQFDSDTARDEANGRYDEYWLAFHDWCAARGILEGEMREGPDYQAQFEAEFYGD